MEHESSLLLFEWDRWFLVSHAASYGFSKVVGYRFVIYVTFNTYEPNLDTANNTKQIGKEAFRINNPLCQNCLGSFN